MSFPNSHSPYTLTEDTGYDRSTEGGSESKWERRTKCGWASVICRGEEVGPWGNRGAFNSEREECRGSEPFTLPLLPILLQKPE